MIIQEFEDIQKIWDQQQQTNLYAIDEKALHHRVHRRERQSNRMADVTEFGIMFVVLITFAILILDAILDQEGWQSYLGAILFLPSGIYMWWRRENRLKHQHRFDRSLLGVLDHAIANTHYLASLSGSFTLWFLLPSALGIIVNNLGRDFPLWKWIFVVGAFFLSFLVNQIEHWLIHLPRKRRLVALRKQLLRLEA
ncbi:MAG: hypothetical protein AAF206_15775 [Bacteroidota bacterium]